MQVKNKIISLRKCLYCNKQFPKDELIRLVKINNKLVVDKNKNILGRGYYLKVTPQVLNDPRLITILSKKTHTDLDEKLILDLKN